MISIQQKWIKGKLFQKYWIGDDSTTAKKTVLITLAGFEGGHLPEKSLKSLANEGYDILSLAYAAPPPVLPNTFEEIPIEYLAKAVAWIRAQNKYKFHKVVIIGVSKGAELALLYGSFYQNIDGIIAYSPSCILLPAIASTQTSTANKSPWSYQYKSLPFAPIKKVDANTKSVVYKNYITPWLSNTKILKKAMIQVERIDCPMLLLIGQNDQMWDAVKMSQLIQYKMEASFKPHRVKKQVFENAGHRFFWFGDEEDLPEKTMTIWQKKLVNQSYQFQLGGTHDGNRAAMQKSQKEVFKFLYNIENPPSVDSLDAKFRNLSQ